MGSPNKAAYQLIFFAGGSTNRERGNKAVIWSTPAEAMQCRLLAPGLSLAVRHGVPALTIVDPTSRKTLADAYIPFSAEAEDEEQEKAVAQLPGGLLVEAARVFHTCSSTYPFYYLKLAPAGGSAYYVACGREDTRYESAELCLDTLKALWPEARGIIRKELLV